MNITRNFTSIFYKYISAELRPRNVATNTNPLNNFLLNKLKTDLTLRIKSIRPENGLYRLSDFNWAN